MSAIETTLTPINGAEARKIIKSQMESKIDKIPYLSEGNAFKRIVVGFELIFEAFPPDCPVPTAEWEILIGLPEGEDAIFDNDVKKLEALEKKREELLSSVERIEKFLTKYKKAEVIEVKESDNGVPDELRVKHNLKIPVIKATGTGTRIETRVPASELNK